MHVPPAHGHGRQLWIENLASPHGNELRENRDRDFFGADGANIEADRRVYARQAFRRHSLGEQRVVNPLHFCLAADQAEVTQDRKSTRLNSSHSQISYAVFCLKKKNTVEHLLTFVLS